MGNDIVHVARQQYFLAKTLRASADSLFAQLGGSISYRCSRLGTSLALLPLFSFEVLRRAGAWTTAHVTLIVMADAVQ